jgi:hypothetical protein
MSFSKPKEVNKNPAVKYIEWKGGDEQGHFQYYDKETEKNVIIDLKEFIVIDSDLFSITGYDETSKTRYISNEVRTIHDTLVVRGYKDKRSTVFLQGPYSALKETVKSNNNLRYTKCVYIIVDGELCHLKLTGTSAYEFGDAVLRGGNMQNNVVSHVDVIHGKRGIVKFITPKFAFGRELTADEANLAFEVDSTILQPFLEKYLSKNPTEAQPTEQHNVSWYEFKDNTGKHLGEYTITELYNAHDSLVEAGNVDGPEYEAIHEAVLQHKQYQQGLENQKDKQGKPILDYDIEELKSLEAKTPYNHKAKLLLLTAIERKLEGLAPDETFEEEDDIPF